METTIQVKEIINRVGKNGTEYISVETQQGKMSCFEEDIIKILKSKIGSIAYVDVQESGRFKNIRKILPAKPNETLEETYGAPVEKMKDNFTGAREEKNRSMYVSYAKDIFLEIKKEMKGELSLVQVMDMSIDLVKQAIKAF